MSPWIFRSKNTEEWIECSKHLILRSKGYSLHQVSIILSRSTLNVVQEFVSLLWRYVLRRNYGLWHQRVSSSSVWRTISVQEQRAITTQELGVISVHARLTLTSHGPVTTADLLYVLRCAVGAVPGHKHGNLFFRVGCNLYNWAWSASSDLVDAIMGHGRTVRRTMQGKCKCQPWNNKNKKGSWHRPREQKRTRMRCMGLVNVWAAGTRNIVPRGLPKP